MRHSPYGHLDANHPIETASPPTSVLQAAAIIADSALSQGGAWITVRLSHMKAEGADDHEVELQGSDPI